MLDARLTIANVCWDREHYVPSPSAALDAETAHRLTGRFATAHHQGDRIVLARDPLGLNKLFIGHHPTRGMIATSYLIDLTRAGIPFARTYAVPAGSIFTVDLRRSTTSIHRYATLPPTSGSDRSQEAVAADIADALACGMRRLAATRPDHPVAICLSGGADSSLIAAYARRYLPNHTLTAYTYSYTGGGTGLSQDAAAAQRIAAHLGLPIRLVAADTDAILQALPRALTYGQDWRDFNVHAAIVNDLLAAAIAADHPTVPRPLVITGDLMNELLGDYSPVTYAGDTYYRLPRLDPGKLRVSLTRGIQTGDREVGVFNAHGLEVIQPYGWAARLLLDLPNPVSKPDIITRLAAGALPEDVIHRPKVRAQIGDHDAHQGILPQLLRAGLDARGLQAAFCRTFAITGADELRRVVRAGIHQPPPPTPGGNPS
ncbi:asparagine synthase-related protein [Microbispora sp. NBRC 16548]|uniref:asparagine synthetase B family protein n=1 Tax=Microbispora sp. NBRC 16548 TaxID=3030994 RepID=UPI00160DB393|nr:asparagine synthase-related protein [Microbispora sp. NBRC 16548]GLX06604.1 hypothetical protein Misp03_35310 [Microbispora sp. NBRC 16548]